MFSSLLKWGLCYNQHGFPILWKGWLLRATSCSEGPQIQDLPARKKGTDGTGVGIRIWYTTHPPGSPQLVSFYEKAFPSIPNCICSLTTHCPMCVPLSWSFTHDDQCYQSLHIDQPTSLLELLSECWIDCWSSTLPFYCNRTSNFSWVHCPAAKRPHFSVFHAYMSDP